MSGEINQANELDSSRMQVDPIYDYEINVAGGKKKIYRPIGGTYFYLDEINHPRIRVRINNGNWRRGARARGHDYAQHAGFEVYKVEVWNLDPSIAITGILQTGYGRPMNDLLQVYPDETVPQLRDETPSVVASAVDKEAATGSGVWKLFLPANPLRESVELSTNATTAAFIAFKDETGNSDAMHAGTNLVELVGMGSTYTVRNKSAIWIRHDESDTSIFARSHLFT